MVQGGQPPAAFRDSPRSMFEAKMARISAGRGP